jgi:lysophospholipase L1-like esterase
VTPTLHRMINFFKQYIIVHRLIVFAAFACTLAAGGLAAADDAFVVREGDRVAFVGDAFFENELKSCYLETMLTASFPKANATFRNLGWSGDTVRGTARARFGPPAEGFQHLKEDVLAFKPTVLFICYGMNESFEGESGLAAFSSNYQTLLDAIVPRAARVALITPIRHQKLDPPLPDPTEHNRALLLYIQEIKKIADKRGYRFVDLFNDSEISRSGSTTDGIHLTEPGYFAAATAIGRSLGLSFDPQTVDFSAGKPTDDRRQSKESAVAFRLKTSSRFQPFPALDPRLNRSSSHKNKSDNDFRADDRANDSARSSLIVKFDRIDPNIDVKASEFIARIDGVEVGTLNFDAKGFLRFPIPHGDIERLETLRGAIVEKNTLDFHRRRPENETYLFLFRKHEQGQNAREIPMFDPLVEAKEKAIAELSRPIEHTFELILKESGR